MARKTKLNRSKLGALLAAGKFDAIHGAFTGMTGPMLRTLVDEGVLALDDQANEVFEVVYFLEILEAVDGLRARGSIGDGRLTIDGIDLPSSDPKQQVKFLRMAWSADDICEFGRGGIGVWWD